MATVKAIYITSENGVEMNISTSTQLDSTLKSQIDKSEEIPSNKQIIIPSDMELDVFTKEFKSILIETSSDVFVISHDDGYGTVGSTTHIPLHKLSTEYVVVSTEPDVNRKSQVALAAITDNTTISIMFKMNRNVALNINGNAFYNNDIMNITLHRFETYLIEHETDLSGTFICSSYPIAAFSGNDCNKLENMGACDHLIEQLPPTRNIDKIYIVPPNADGRDSIIKVLAINDSTIYYEIDAGRRVVTLNSFESFVTRISSSQACFVYSENPIIVVNFGLKSKTLEDLADPSMTIVPGINQYLDYYKIVVPSGYDINYVSIMITEASKDSLRINNTRISVGDVLFEKNVAAGNVTYNVRSIRVKEGELSASTVDGERFGLMFSGVTYYEAYGFSGNSLTLEDLS